MRINIVSYACIFRAFMQLIACIRALQRSTPGNLQARVNIERIWSEDHIFALPVAPGENGQPPKPATELSMTLTPMSSAEYMFATA